AVSLWGTLAACALMGCLLNFALFLCTVNNSALTTTIVGVLKGVVAVFLGFFLLGGVRFSAVNVAGIALNTAGAIWYSVIKYREKKSTKRSVLASASIEQLSSALGGKDGSRDAEKGSSYSLADREEGGGAGGGEPLQEWSPPVVESTSTATRRHH
ncbi:hypothetical protein Agub_g15271, partial [Astrephomene gubernaculifera]